MIINDPLIHPSLLDPRQWADVNLYDSTINLEREPIKGVEHHTPDRPFLIKHLKLDLRFDDDRQKVSGTVALTLTPMNNGFKHFELDIAEMHIATVKLLRVEKRGTGDLIQSATHLGVGLEFETRQDKLTIELDRFYARAEHLIIEIGYSCSPRKGIYFVKPDESYPHKPHQIWSQGETEDAHWWFPCHDVPNQKMTTELLATVKSNFFALSNGELVGVRDFSLEPGAAASRLSGDDRDRRIRAYA
jgi:aminopeptidase N